MAMQRVSEKKKLNDQEIAMAEFFQSVKLEMKVQYIAEVKFKPEDKYPMDKFSIVFIDNDTRNSTSFDFYKGIGHRVTINKGFVSSTKLTNIIKPSIADVMYNLLSDYECGQMTFEDFCSDLGYNYDSIKDMNLHREIV